MCNYNVQLLCKTCITAQVHNACSLADKDNSVQDAITSLFKLFIFLFKSIHILYFIYIRHFFQLIPYVFLMDSKKVTIFIINSEKI